MVFIFIAQALIHGGLIGLSILFVYLCVRKNRINECYESVQVEHIKLWFLLIFTIAVLVRVIQFGNIPGGLNQDEARTAVDAKALLEYGIDKFGIKNPAWLSSPLEGHQSVMLAWLQMPFIKVFGYSILTIRLPMLVISLLGIVALFFYVRDIKGDRIALIVMALCAICPYYIMKSRWALDCDVFAHFALFGMLFLNKLKKKYVYLSMLFFGFSMYCYGLSFITIPFLLFFSAIWLYKRKVVDLKDILLCMIIYFGVSLPEWATMVINALKLDTITLYGLTCPYCPNSVRSSDLLFTNFNFMVLLKNIWYIFKIVFLQGFDSSVNQIRYIGPYYIFSVPFLFYGIYKMITFCRKEKKSEKTIRSELLIIYGLAGLCSGILVQVNANRIGYIFYPVLVFVGIGISEIISRSSKCGYYFSGVYLLCFTVFCLKYFGEYKDTQGFHTDFCKAVSDKDIQQEDDKLYKISTGIGMSKTTQESILMFYHQVTPYEYQEVEKMRGGFYFHEKYTYYLLSEESKENVELNDIWIVHDDAIEYLESEYELNILDYGTWNIVTVVAENS